eukprot:scpid105847/ scgid24214/ 
MVTFLPLLFVLLVVFPLYGVCAYLLVQTRRGALVVAGQEPAYAVRATGPSSTTAPSGLGQDARSRPNSQQSRVRTPFVFTGDATTFREWVFSVEIAMKSQGVQNPGDMVDFTTTHLSENACLWFLNAQDAGEVFPDWPSFKSKLAEVF